MTIRDEVSMKEEISASDILAENSTLFVDNCGVPLLVSKDKITLVSNMLSEHIPIL